MTLEQIGWLLGQFTGTDKYPEELELLINFAQEQYFRANVDDEGIVFPFIKHMGIDNGTMPMTVSSKGLASIPSDFERHIEFSFMYNGGQEQIERVENWEFHHRLTQAIEIPTRHYPIATYIGDKIKFAPSNLQFVNYTYLSKPAPVVYATKLQNGMAVYDADNSTELLWTEHDQVEIVKILLMELGINVTTEQIKTKINEK